MCVVFLRLWHLTNNLLPFGTLGAWNVSETEIRTIKTCVFMKPRNATVIEKLLVFDETEDAVISVQIESYVRDRGPKLRSIDVQHLLSWGVVCTYLVHFRGVHVFMKLRWSLCLWGECKEDTYTAWGWSKTNKIPYLPLALDLFLGCLQSDFKEHRDKREKRLLGCTWGFPWKALLIISAKISCSQSKKKKTWFQIAPWCRVNKPYRVFNPWFHAVRHPPPPRIMVYSSVSDLPGVMVQTAF